MSALTISKLLLVITVLGLFVWTFRGQKHFDQEIFKYGRYMIYLLVLEIAAIVLFGSG